MPALKIPFKLAIILALMSFGPILIGMLAGLFRSDNEDLYKGRSALCRTVASNCSIHLSEKDSLAFMHSCAEALDNEVGLLSLRVLKYDGNVLFESDSHSEHWKLSPDQASTADQVRIPLMQGLKVQAELELAFQPIERSRWEVLAHWGIVCGVGFALNFRTILTLWRRAVRYVDPKRAVPRRVRNTLDTMVGGVVILDKQGRILLANDSFAKYVGKSVGDVTGQELKGINWEKADPTDEDWPWETALQKQTQKAGVKVQLPFPVTDGVATQPASRNSQAKKPDDVAGKPAIEQARELVGETLRIEGRRTFMVNATPIFDRQDVVSGALVSFEDITFIEQQRCHLLDVLADLEKSKEQIDHQNQVLQELAIRDGLTGIYNRRALFERLETLWNSRRDAALASGLAEQEFLVMLLDVDRFKKLNDLHGHMVGDHVLQEVVKIIQRVIEGRAWFARYGGEEFCVVCERLSLESGVILAKEICQSIERELADPFRVTLSLGVTARSLGAENVQALIEQADQALYAAKHRGRNGYCVWSPELGDGEEGALRESACSSAIAEVESRISYHAVVTLNAVLSCRYPIGVSHSYRVSEICVAMAKNWLPVGKLYLLETAGMLHDIGCLALSDRELAELKSLETLGGLPMGAPAGMYIAKQGAQILRSAFQAKELLEMLEFQATPYRNDGQVSGESLPVGARIIAIANAYENLTSGRNGPPMQHEEAVDWLAQHEGEAFDPVWVERLSEAKPEQLVARKDEAPESCGNASLVFGYQLDRVIHSFETRNRPELSERLRQLELGAEELQMPAVTAILQELQEETDRKEESDWGTLLPVLQDLVEVCLSVQRAYLHSTDAQGKLAGAPEKSDRDRRTITLPPNET